MSKATAIFKAFRNACHVPMCRNEARSQLPAPWELMPSLVTWPDEHWRFAPDLGLG